MFNNHTRGTLSTAQRFKINQENEGIQLTNTKGAGLQSRFPGSNSTKQVFGDVKNKLDATGIKSTSVLGGFSNTKNSPFPVKWSQSQPEALKPKQIPFHEDRDELSLDIDSLLDTFPIPKPKRHDPYGFSSTFFDFTNEELDNIIYQPIDEFQESPKMFNDDFHNLHELPETRSRNDDISFDSELPLCMTANWEAGNNSIMDLVNEDSTSRDSFVFDSGDRLAMDEEDELPDFFTFKFD